MFLLVTSCGFQLRGTTTTPQWLKKGVAVVVEDATPDWQEQLDESLEANHIPVINNPQKAHYWLVIHKESLTQTIVSVSSSTTPRQYQLVYLVSFSIQTPKGKQVFGPAEVSVTRPLTINNDRVLGSRNEGEKLKTEMKQDATQKIIDLIYSKAKHSSY